MAVDSRYSQVMNVKRKLYSWVMSFLGESKDSASECASGKQLVPDAKDIVGILKSTGFRLVDVAMGQHSAGAASNALCCRVIVTCAKSGLSAVLESEAECRCPEEAMGDGASTWCVMSPSASQESLDKSWNVTASSLMPNVASHVAEVVGAATRFLVQLLEDKGLPTPARGAAALGRAARARGATQDLSRALSGRTPSVPVLPMDTPGSNTRRRSQPLWLEDLQWELALRDPPGMDTPLPDISGLSLSGSQSFSRSENQLPQVGVIGPPRRQSSTLEDYALQGKLSEDEDAKVVFDEHMRLTEQTRVLRSPSYAVVAAADAKSTATSPPAAAAAATATTTATATPTPALASVVPAGAIAAEVSAPAAKVSAPAQFRVPVSAADVGDGNQQTQTSTGNDCNGQQANTALLLPRRAQEALQTAEGFMQNMSSIMEMLRMWTTPVEDSPVGAESKRPRARTDVLVPPPNVVRASPRATSPALLVPRAGPARKSAPAGGLKVDVTRPTKSRMLAARAALRLRAATPRPSTARVNAHLGPAERAGVIRAAARGQSQRAAAAAASMARASAPASARASAPAPATPPVASVSAPSGSPTVSPTMGPPPQPPPRRPSLECADNSSSASGAASPRAAAGTTITTRVMFTSSGAAGRTISRVPPVRSAPPPPPKPLKRPPK